MAETRVTRLRAQPRAWTAPGRWRAKPIISNNQIHHTTRELHLIHLLHLLRLSLY
jgi:hypothetical protein